MTFKSERQRRNHEVGRARVKRHVDIHHAHIDRRRAATGGISPFALLSMSELRNELRLVGIQLEKLTGLKTLRHKLVTRHNTMLIDASDELGDIIAEKARIDLRIRAIDDDIMTYNIVFQRRSDLYDCVFELRHPR